MGEVDDAEYVRNFINDRCIARVPPGSKRLPAYNNQGFYTWQFYLREALFNPRVLSIIVRDFLMQYEEHLKTGNVQLCGVESSSTPLLTGIAIACAARGYDVNIFSIRKEQKTYGRRNWIEGKVLPNKFAMMVDDIISDSHKTAIHGATILADHGIEPANCTYAVVFKSDKLENTIKLLGYDVTVTSMFDLNDFDLTTRPETPPQKIHQSQTVPSRPDTSLAPDGGAKFPWPAQ